MQAFIQCVPVNNNSSGLTVYLCRQIKMGEEQNGIGWVSNVAITHRLTATEQRRMSSENKNNKKNDFPLGVYFDSTVEKMKLFS